MTVMDLAKSMIGKRVTPPNTSRCDHMRLVSAVIYVIMLDKNSKIPAFGQQKTPGFAKYLGEKTDHNSDPIL